MVGARARSRRARPDHQIARDVSKSTAGMMRGGLRERRSLPRNGERVAAIGGEWLGFSRRG